MINTLLGEVTYHTQALQSYAALIFRCVCILLCVEHNIKVERILFQAKHRPMQYLKIWIPPLDTCLIFHIDVLRKARSFLTAKVYYRPEEVRGSYVQIRRYCMGKLAAALYYFGKPLHRKPRGALSLIWTAHTCRIYPRLLHLNILPSFRYSARTAQWNRTR